MGGTASGRSAVLHGETPRSLAALFRPSVQPCIISWFRYRPSTKIARLTIPVLIIQGTTDIQVSTAEAIALKAAKPDAQLQMIDGMNHVPKQVPANHEQQVTSYSDPALALSPQLTAAIVDFIHAILLRAH